MICIKCGSINDAQVNYCKKCGAVIIRFEIADDSQYGHLNISSVDGKNTSQLGASECLPCREIREVCEGILAKTISLEQFNKIIDDYFIEIPERIDGINKLLQDEKASSVPEVIEMYNYMLNSYDLILQALDILRQYDEEKAIFWDNSQNLLHQANEEMAKGRDIAIKLEEESQ